jgi:hypothetical protein
MPPGPITGPSAWRGEDLARSEDWIHRLSDADIAEIDAALASARDRGLGLMDIDRAAFPLPRLGKALDAIHRELLTGRGFVLIRGLPMDRYTTEDAAMAYWGIGRYLGNPVSQNAKGHLLGHVRDLITRIPATSSRSSACAGRAGAGTAASSARSRSITRSWRGARTCSRCCSNRSVSTAAARCPRA